MWQLLSLRKTALAGASALVAAGLTFPAVASASVSAPAQSPAVVTEGVDWVRHGPPPRDWVHPEWGRGWNNGYPAPGWVPPAGWYPPPDWTPPAGWYPPAGWAPPAWWVGPCRGPLFDLFHPVRCR